MQYFWKQVIFVNLSDKIWNYFTHFFYFFTFYVLHVHEIWNVTCLFINKTLKFRSKYENSLIYCLLGTWKYNFINWRFLNNFYVIVLVFGVKSPPSSQNQSPIFLKSWKCFSYLRITYIFYYCCIVEWRPNSTHFCLQIHIVLTNIFLLNYTEIAIFLKTGNIW